MYCHLLSKSKLLSFDIFYKKTHKMYKIDSLVDGTYAVIHLVSKKVLTINNKAVIVFLPPWVYILQINLINVIVGGLRKIEKSVILYY